jgi:hypothetical protein
LSALGAPTDRIARISSDSIGRPLLLDITMNSSLSRARCLGTALLLTWAASGAFAQTVSVPPSPTTPALASAAASQVSAARIGTFKQVQGDAWIGVDTARRAAQPGAGIGLADRLSTGPQGGATLTLKDGTVLTMGPDSVMDLRQFQFDPTTQQGNVLLDLLRGSVRVVTGLLAKVNPELFKLQTPTSVVGVRGTDFIVETQHAR